MLLYIVYTAAPLSAKSRKSYAANAQPKQAPVLSNNVQNGQDDKQNGVDGKG